MISTSPSSSSDEESPDSRDDLFTLHGNASDQHPPVSPQFSSNAADQTPISIQHTPVSGGSTFHLPTPSDGDEDGGLGYITSQILGKEYLVSPEQFKMIHDAKEYGLYVLITVVIISLLFILRNR